MPKPDIEVRPPREIDGEPYHFIPRKYQGKFDHGFNRFGGSFYINFQQSPHLQQLYQEIASGIKDKPNLSILDQLTSVNQRIAQQFPPVEYADVVYFGSDRASELNKNILSLDEFVAGRKALCGHASLTGAVILEKLVENGLIQGQPFVDSFADSLPQATVDGHIWYGFETPDRKRFLMDALYDYCGDEEGYKKVLDEVMFYIIRSVH